MAKRAASAGSVCARSTIAAARRTAASAGGSVPVRATSAAPANEPAPEAASKASTRGLSRGGTRSPCGRGRRGSTAPRSRRMRLICTCTLPTDASPCCPANSWANSLHGRVSVSGRASIAARKSAAVEVRFLETPVIGKLSHGRVAPCRATLASGRSDSREQESFGDGDYALAHLGTTDVAVHCEDLQRHPVEHA